MKLSRERKVFVLICALAVVALIVDKAFLGRAGGAEEAWLDPMSLLVGPSRSADGSPVAPRGGTAQTASDGAGGSAAAVTELLAQMAARHRAPLDQTPDAFRPSAAWFSGVAAPETPRIVAPDRHVENFVKRKLTSVTAGGRSGAGAMVDGTIVHVGQSLDGFKLIAVDERSALFQLRSTQVRLSLSGEVRITHVRGNDS